MSYVALLVAAILAAPAMMTAATAAPPASRADDGVLRVLLFFKTNFHGSNVQQRIAVKDLAAQLGVQYGQTVEVQETDNANAFTTENLANKDVIVFAQTGGVLFNDDQRAALETYIRGGGGHFGMHYNTWSRGTVSETEANPFYLELLGAQSNTGHPEPAGGQNGRVYLDDTTHPLNQGLVSEIVRKDEWYNWDVNPAQNVRTLAWVDESSYSPTPPEGMGEHGTAHPVTWCHTIDEGRSWYSSMGHDGAAFSEPYILGVMRNGLAYTAGLLEADCSPPAKDEEGHWSDVTPWPLMPINMALTSDGKVQSFGSVGGWGSDTTPFDFSGDSSITQGGQTEIDVWDPAEPRTLDNYRDGLIENATYTDLFCSMQVQNPHTKATMTVGGDDSLGGNAPNDAAIGVTSYKTNTGLVDAAPMNYPRWYPTGTTTADGDILVQGGSLSGGPGGNGVLTPEIYRPDEGNSWKMLTGAKSQAAYGDGGDGNPDENRWWYPRAFVAPGSGKIFTITGTQMFDVDTNANGGAGELTLRGRLAASVANQGANGNPVGATSTAVMYRPGKILQVGGGTWSNGGGGNGARAGFTVDITGGTANPVQVATEPMQYQRHWPTSTVLPDGNVIVTGGSRVNNGDGGYVTNAEIWNPETGQWKTVKAPYAHARLYHSTALLLPDGRLMIGGGGAPGPRNYTDVEYYSPSYLFDGDEPAERPEITSGPKKIGYDGAFKIGASDTVSRVTLVRNGSVTHGFNNDQNFQDLEFSQSGHDVTITAPQDSTYAPPGSYMLFVFDADGTPSVAKIVDIDPTVKMKQVQPKVVDQFEYPRLPVEWRGANPAATINVAPGNDRMSPWKSTGQVQLVRAATAANRSTGLGLTGYQLSVPPTGSIERTLRGLDPGHEYRVSLRYARDSRTEGSDPGVGTISVADLEDTITATTANPSAGDLRDTTFGTYVANFTATAKSQTLRLAGGAGAGLMIDDLVVVAQSPGLDDAPVHYEFEEGEGTSAANTGSDDNVGPATLTGSTAWSDEGTFGKALDLSGGDDNANVVRLPDNLLQGEENFTTSFWVRPDSKKNWISMFQIGDGVGDAGSFFQIQMQTQAQGNTGLAATFKAKGSTAQERVYATPTKDVDVDQWSHVVFTRAGGTGTLYLNGQQVASRDDLTIDMTDVGPTSSNWLGRNGYDDPGFDGLVDDVRLYTSALGATDVSSLYADGSALRTTTTMTVTPESPSVAGDPLTVAAEVEGSDNEDAEGQVELWVDGARSGTTDLVEGKATFADFTLNRGDHELEVRYQPADGWRSSSATTTQTILRRPPAPGIPVHYAFDEPSGTAALNTGTDTLVGSATVNPGWRTTAGKFGGGIDLPGGGGASGNHVQLPNDIASDLEDEFSVSVWANPRALPNWVPLLQIGSSTDTFFLLQSSTQANGATGFAATFKEAGNADQQRLLLGGGNDLPLNTWTHVVFTMSGGTGKIYFDGQLKATKTDFTLGIDDVGIGGHTTANFLGGTSWPDPRWNGLVDDFQLYGHELDQDEVTGIFEGPPASADPVAGDDRFHAVKGQPLTVSDPGVLDNDVVADGATVTAVDATQPAHGEVTLATDGSFTYTPDAGYVGADTFTYRASDGTSKSAPATVTIVVAPPKAVDAAPIQYELEEGAGTSAANTGYDNSVGDAELQGSSAWAQDAERGTVVNLPGGASTTQSHVKLPNDVDQDLEDDFSVSIWANPRALPNWVPLLQIGSSTDTFFLLQSSTQAGPGNSASGFAATFKKAGDPDQERLTLGAGNDLPLNEWTHVVFTMSGGTGKLYFDGELMGTRTDYNLGIGDIGVGGHTTANFIGGTSWPDPRWNGMVDDARIYGHELSADDVTALFEGPSENAAPVGAADSYSTQKGSSLKVKAPGVLGNDTDADGDELTATGVTQPAHGSVTLAADGSFTYQPQAAFVGTDTFTYRASDGTSESEPTTVTISVLAPKQVATKVTGTAAVVAYGRAGTVTARVTPAAATGKVQVLRGTKVLATGTVKAGAARIALPAKVLAPGRHNLTVRYVGDPGHGASTGAVKVTVKKVSTAIKVKSAKKLKVGKRATVKIVVKAPYKVPVTGKVTIKVKGKLKGKKRTFTAKVVNGKVTFKLPKAAKKGKLKVTVTYGGNTFASGVRGTTVIKVRR